MKKQFVPILMIAACIAMTATCGNNDAAKDQSPQSETAAKPVIISRVSAAPRQKSVAFDHNAHTRAAAASGKNCTTCHHRGTINQKCSAPGCHFGPGAEKHVHVKCYGDCHLAEASAPKRAQCATCHRQ